MGDLLNANCVKFLELPLSIWTILEEQKEKKNPSNHEHFLGGGDAILKYFYNMWQQKQLKKNPVLFCLFLHPGCNHTF